MATDIKKLHSCANSIFEYNFAQDANFMSMDLFFSNVFRNFALRGFGFKTISPPFNQVSLILDFVYSGQIMF